VRQALAKTLACLLPHAALAKRRVLRRAGVAVARCLVAFGTQSALCPRRQAAYQGGKAQR